MRRKPTHLLLSTLPLWLFIIITAASWAGSSNGVIVVSAAAADATVDVSESNGKDDSTNTAATATTEGDNDVEINTDESAMKNSEECTNDDDSGDQTCTNNDTPPPQQQEEVKVVYEQKFNSANERLITQPELTYHGIKSTESKEAATAGGHTIWLSILGRVYDVTSGGPSYYGPKGSYNFYSGRDASPCFHTGQNNEEGASAPLETWEDDKHLMSVYDWSLFYEKHDVYTFMGVLINSKYYNEEGEETDIRKDIVKRASAAKEIVEAERAERKRKREEKRKKKKK
jgi:cytochrome b involved in lipid metabolism